MIYLRNAGRVIRHLLMIFFIAPATLSIFVVLMAYDFSPYAVARGVYGEIGKMTQLSKTAPEGYIGVEKCLDKPITSTREILSAPLGCQKKTVKFWSVDNLARNTVESLSTVYWCLLLIGVLLTILWIGPKKLFLMDVEEPSTST